MISNIIQRSVSPYHPWRYIEPWKKNRKNRLIEYYRHLYLSKPPDIALVGHITEDVLILLDSIRAESIGGMVSYAGGVLSNLGCHIGIVSIVGKNFPLKYENYFKGLDIDMEGFHKDSEYTTRSVLTQINEKDRDFVIEHMADMLLPHHIPKRYLGAQIFYFGPLNSFLAVKTSSGIKKIHDELPLETIKYVAKNSNAIIMVDAQGYTRVKDETGKNTWTTWDDKEEFYRYIDILKVNDYPEAALVADTEDPIEAARKIYIELQAAHKDTGHLGNEIVIVTMGKEGALVVEDSIIYHINAAIPEKVVDTTGAGDSFGAGFIWSYMQGFSAAESAITGSIVASYVIERLGASGFPDKKKVEKRYMAQKKLLKPEVVGRIRK